MNSILCMDTSGTSGADSVSIPIQVYLRSRTNVGKNSSRPILEFVAPVEEIINCPIATLLANKVCKSSEKGEGLTFNRPASGWDLINSFQYLSETVGRSVSGSIPNSLNWFTMYPYICDLILQLLLVCVYFWNGVELVFYFGPLCGFDPAILPLACASKQVSTRFFLWDSVHLNICFPSFFDAFGDRHRICSTGSQCIYT